MFVPACAHTRQACCTEGCTVPRPCGQPCAAPVRRMGASSSGLSSSSNRHSVTWVAWWDTTAKLTPGVSEGPREAPSGWGSPAAEGWVGRRPSGVAAKAACSLLTCSPSCARALHWQLEPVGKLVPSSKRQKSQAGARLKSPQPHQPLPAPAPCVWCGHSFWRPHLAPRCIRPAPLPSQALPRPPVLRCCSPLSRPRQRAGAPLAAPAVWGAGLGPASSSRHSSEVPTAAASKTALPLLVAVTNARDRAALSPSLRPQDALPYTPRPPTAPSRLEPCALHRWQRPGVAAVGCQGLNRGRLRAPASFQPPVRPEITPGSQCRHGSWARVGVGRVMRGVEGWDTAHSLINPEVGMLRHC